MGSLAHVDVDAQPLDRLAAVIGSDATRKLRKTLETAAAKLHGRSVWNVNSTAEGGGVAELLSMLLPYLRGAGWDVRWAVTNGDEEFFDVTKDIHNALHGAPPTNGGLEQRGRDIYSRTTAASADELADLVRPGDVVIVHDPQPAGVVPRIVELGARVAWQCHIGTDTPNEDARDAWTFLRPYVAHADRYVFSREAYLWEGLAPSRARVIPPTIDALSPKNAPMTDDEATSVLTAAGILQGRIEATLGIRRQAQRIGGEVRIDDGAPIVLQVSRWDRLKDPIGFMRMFDHLADIDDVHLVFAGPMTDGVGDDPEGDDVHAACEEVWRSLSPDAQERVHLLSLPMDDADENAVIVNALQRHATVVVQKSLEEGFGLTVSEAMWKRKPVVASRVGGIQDQIEHTTSGLLVDDPYDIGSFADAVRTILGDPDCARRLGAAARQRVRDRFLAPRQLVQYAELVNELSA